MCAYLHNITQYRIVCWVDPHNTTVECSESWVSCLAFRAFHCYFPRVHWTNNGCWIILCDEFDVEWHCYLWADANHECCWLITSFDVVGKDQAIKLKAIETLLPFLHHIEPRIQAFGIAALMRYLTIAFYSQFILFVSLKLASKFLNHVQKCWITEGIVFNL